MGEEGAGRHHLGSSYDAVLGLDGRWWCLFFLRQVGFICRSVLTLNVLGTLLEYGLHTVYIHPVHPV